MDHTGHAMPPEGIEAYAAAAPHLLGYHPDQALVVIPLTRTPRPLPALALPLNPPPGAEQLARRLRPLAPAYARQEVLLYTFSDRPESAAVARDVIAHLAPRRVLADVAIDGDDWTTRNHSAIGQISDGTRTRVAAEYAFAGRPMPANSLAEIITSFDDTSPGLPPAEIDNLVRQMLTVTADPAAAAEERRWLATTLRDHADAGPTLPDPIAARVVAAMQDVLVRDYLISDTLTLDNATKHAPIWKDLTRRTPEQYRSPIASAAAMAYWLSHDTPTARAALNHVPDPDYRLAQIISQSLDLGVRPATPQLEPDPSLGRSAEHRTPPARPATAVDLRW